jgi:putative SOS response-associated peptidase YedK
MCGRATYKLTWEEIVALYRLTLGQPAVNTRARYNVCPTTTIDTILDQDGKRRLERIRWGLIPSWWSKPLKEMKLATFNARAETVAIKPMFRSAFKRNRCLIPVSGYYEWQDTPDGKPRGRVPTTSPAHVVAYTPELLYETCAKLRHVGGG